MRSCSACDLIPRFSVLMSEVTSEMIMQNIQLLADSAQAQGYTCVVGALIVSSTNKIFVHKRSANRRLFPNCWDIVGGHVEEGETLQQALDREIGEETGWSFGKTIDFVGEYEWNSDGQKSKEFVLLIKATGDMESPKLELGKVSEYRWISKEDLPLLKENRPVNDTYMHDVVLAGFKKLADAGSY